MHTILRHEAILHICDFGHWVSMGYKCDFTHLLFLVLREPTCNECNELLIGGEKKWNFRWRCYTLKRCNISIIGKRRKNWKLRLSNLDKMCTDIFEGIWVSVNYGMSDDLMFWVNHNNWHRNERSELQMDLWFFDQNRPNWHHDWTVAMLHSDYLLFDDE